MYEYCVLMRCFMLSLLSYTNYPVTKAIINFILMLPNYHVYFSHYHHMLAYFFKILLLVVTDKINKNLNTWERWNCRR